MPCLGALNSPVGLLTHCLLPSCLTAFGPHLKGRCAGAKLAMRCLLVPCQRSGEGQGAVGEEHP